MQIDITRLGALDQYKLISSTVVPRPIALVTTRSASGIHNAAPFSFFNAMGEDPPILALAVEAKRGSGAPKDTIINIRDTGQFVVHTVDEDLAAAMNVCAIDFPSGVDETAQAGLTRMPSQCVRPDRIAEAPVAFECEKLVIVQISPNRNIVLGRVVMMHVRDGLLDAGTGYVNAERYRPVGRLFGRVYARTRDQFEMTVPTYDEWLRRDGVEPGRGSRQR